MDLQLFDSYPCRTLEPDLQTLVLGARMQPWPTAVRILQPRYDQRGQPLTLGPASQEVD
jgi:hypothetical protein